MANFGASRSKGKSTLRQVIVKSQTREIKIPEDAIVEYRGIFRDQFEANIAWTPVAVFLIRHNGSYTGHSKAIPLGEIGEAIRGKKAFDSSSFVDRTIAATPNAVFFIKHTPLDALDMAQIDLNETKGWDQKAIRSLSSKEKANHVDGAFMKGDECSINSTAEAANAVAPRCEM